MITRILAEHQQVIAEMEADMALQGTITLAVKMWCNALNSGGKVLFCGNGGSAADAQHLAAELSGRFLKDRRALYAEALTVNPSAMTAIGNDFGFDQIFSRQVEAFAKAGDVLCVLSTSGNSRNVVNAVKAAQRQNVFVIGFTGAGPSEVVRLADIAIQIPSKNTPRIQEGHLLIGHIICELVETTIFGEEGG